MKGVAKGPFSVKRTVEAVRDPLNGLLGQHALDKTYEGDLAGSALGTMIAAGGTVPGSAGYVAIERVEAKLNGKAGTFYLQHNGILNRSAASLTIVVIPDTGTGDLAGLSGEMTIRIESGGAHFYEFTYELPDAG